jgi:hypothetical protein
LKNIKNNIDKALPLFARQKGAEVISTNDELI